MRGQIVKISADKYFVKTKKDVICASAKGVLKIKSQGIVTGDFINVDEKDNVITEIYPRKSFFIRPSIANIEMLNIVISHVPEPDFMLVDKLIVAAAHNGIIVNIIVNKTDLSEKLCGYINSNYIISIGDVGRDDLGAPVLQELDGALRSSRPTTLMSGNTSLNFGIFFVSAKTLKGLDELKQKMRGFTACFAGQSAAGKSSLINALLGLNLKEGGLSSIRRGRHTTTSAEIFEKDGLKIIDTPGFSSIHLNDYELSIKDCYAEFNTYAHECRFLDCKHINEKECGVKRAVAGGKISKDRYERYKKITEEYEKFKKYVKN